MRSSIACQSHGALVENVHVRRGAQTHSIGGALKDQQDENNTGCYACFTYGEGFALDSPKRPYTGLSVAGCD